MKLCPTCGEVYPDQSTECRAHNTELHDWADATETHTGEPTAVDNELDDSGALFDSQQMMTAGEFTEPEIHLRGASIPSSNVTIDPSLFQDTPKPRRVLGDRYRLGRHIGIGGYGAVFDAYDERLSKRVAVKILSPAVSQDAEVVARFQREAIAASRVRHECIVDVTDFDVDPAGTSFIVMEYLDGCDLSDVIDDDGPLKPPRALAIAAQCASALTAAHAAGILHRDLKPANIFLVNSPSRPDFVKIIDFGISKITGADGNYSNVTSASKVVGTPFYMPPEQARGQHLDGRTDVYALGVMLYEMLTDTRPFVGVSALEILGKAMNDRRIAPSRVRPRLGSITGLDALVLRAISIDRDDRFASMEAFGAAIMQCLAGLDQTRTVGLPAIVSGAELSEWTHPRATGTRADATTNLSPRKPSTLDASSGEITAARRLSRRRNWILSSIGAAASVAALIGFGVSSGSDSGGAAPEPSLQNTQLRQPAAAPKVERAARGSDEGTRPAAARLADEGPEPAGALRKPDRQDSESQRPQRASLTVHLSSSPPGAVVSQSGRGSLGATPLDVTLRPLEERANLSLELAGRATKKVTIDRSSGDGVHVRLTRRRRARPKTTAPKRAKRGTMGRGIKDW